MKLAPSLLSANFLNLSEQLNEISLGGAHYLHIDVMDGHFVPNISFGPPVIKSIQAEKSMFDLVFDAHLMISEPIKYVKAFAECGCDIINFHVEAPKSHAEIVAVIEEIRSYGKKVGMTIKPGTSAEALFPYMEYLDLALVMSVEPGFGGQKFMRDMLKKAEILAKKRDSLGMNFEIEMDGGIDLSNVKDAANAGVNVFVAGSSVFLEKDLQGTVRKFYDIFKEFE